MCRLYTTDSSTEKSVPGAVGNAILFDGVNDHVLFPDTSASPMDFGLGDWITISAWIRPLAFPNLSSMTILLKGDSIGPNQSKLKFAVTVPASQGKPEFSYMPTASWFIFTSTANQLATLGQWYHLAATYQYDIPGSALLFVNGVQVVGSSWNVSPNSVAHTPDDHPIVIGYNLPASDQPFEGAIDEVSVWRRQLTSAEIQTIHTVQNPL